jgi:hypothetical protein
VSIDFRNQQKQIYTQKSEKTRCIQIISLCVLNHDSRRDILSNQLMGKKHMFKILVVEFSLAADVEDLQ